MPKEKYDTEILDEAMNNAYDIIIGKYTFEEIMETTGEACLPFDIRKEDPDLTGMIEYFIETEEYDKCTALQKLINEETKTRCHGEK
jgi:methyl coenzyme M reductase subunit D